MGSLVTDRGSGRKENKRGYRITWNVELSEE